MICAVCGPLERHDGEHCEKCHAVHDALRDQAANFYRTLPRDERGYWTKVDKQTPVR